MFFINEAPRNFAWYFSENSFCPDILKREYLQTETNYKYLGFCVGRERLLICLFHISISCWSWSLSKVKVIAENLWLLKDVWSWRFKCHINWLLGKSIVLLKNHRKHVNSTFIHYLLYVMTLFSVGALKRDKCTQLETKLISAIWNCLAFRFPKFLQSLTRSYSTAQSRLFFFSLFLFFF